MAFARLGDLPHRHYMLACATLLTALLAPGVAAACRCVQQPDAEAQLALYDLMFVGRARSSDLTGKMGVTTFRVDKTLKGRPMSSLQLAHDISSTCAVHFEVGKTYALLVSRRGDTFFASACSLAQFPAADYRQLKVR